MRHLILFSLLSLLVSCADKNSEPQIRFVNLQGKSRDLAMRYPEKNLEALNKKPPSQNSSYSDAVVNSVDEIVVNAGVESKKATPKNPKEEIISYDLAQNRVSPNFPPKKTEVVEYNLAKEPDSKPNLVEQTQKEAQIQETKEPKVTQVFVTSDIKKSKKTASKRKKTSKARKSSNKTSYFVQVGAFSRNSSAKNVLAAMKKYDLGIVKKVSTKNRTLYKVWLGPYSSKTGANQTVKKVKASGREAIIVKN